MKPDDPAFPAQPVYRIPDGAEIAYTQGGMSLRCYLAVKAMQGVISAGNLTTPYADKRWRIAEEAVLLADALLAELNK